MKMKRFRGLGTKSLAIATALVVCVLSVVTAAPAVAGKVKGSAPAPPQGVVAAAIDPGVCIDWLPAAEGGVSGYYVYAKSSKGWKRFNRKPITDNHYYDPKGTAGKDYAVRAVNVNGVKSDLAVAVAVEAVPVIHEENDPRISAQGIWTVEDYPGASGGAIMVASSSGSMLRFRFTGRQVKLIAVNHSGCGQANVYMDNNFVATVDMYSPNPLFQQVEVSVPGLKYGEHEIAVLVLGYGNPGGADNFVNVDAFEVR